MSVEIFQQGTQISRADVNTRFDQVLQMFPPTIAKGGTARTTVDEARDSLGAYSRIVLYKNTSGATGTVDLANINVYHDIRWIGAYIGNSNIQRYVEFPIWYETNYISAPVTMYYLTVAGNLLIRCGEVMYLGNRHKFNITSTGVYHFDPSGNTWMTSEDLYIYEVSGFFLGRDV